MDLEGLIRYCFEIFRSTVEENSLQQPGTTYLVRLAWDKWRYLPRQSPKLKDYEVCGPHFWVERVEAPPVKGLLWWSHSGRGWRSCRKKS